MSARSRWFRGPTDLQSPMVDMYFEKSFYLLVEQSEKLFFGFPGSPEGS